MNGSSRIPCFLHMEAGFPGIIYMRPIFGKDQREKLGTLGEGTLAVVSKTLHHIAP